MVLIFLFGIACFLALVAMIVIVVMAFWRLLMEQNTERAVPNPGSAEAQTEGCKCPIIDNGYGKGCGRVNSCGEPMFWINEECPLHGPLSDS